MKGTSILSWKLPISRRDSQRLLSLLNISFSQALDREHPKVSAAGRNSTEEHLHSILSSPHFEPKRTPMSPPILPFSRVTLKNSAIAMVAHNARNFKEHVAAGTASLDMAKHYLKMPCAILAQSRRAGLTTEIDSLKSIGFGSITANWLWSTGMSRLPAVLADSVLLERLTPLLVVEGQSCTIWSWLDHFRSLEADCSRALPDLDHPLLPAIRSHKKLLSLLTDVCSERDDSSARSMLCSKDALECTNPTASFLKHYQCRQAQRKMLFYFVINTHQYGSGLQDAIKVFLHTAATLPTHQARPAKHFMLHRVGVYIVDAVLRSAKVVHLDPAIYDAFVEFQKDWGGLHGIQYAILVLCHPSKPSAQVAYSWLRADDFNTTAPTYRWRNVRLGLVAADHLLSTKTGADMTKAKKIMDVLEKHYAVELGDLRNTANTASSKPDSTAAEPLNLLYDDTKYVQLAT